MRSEKTHRIRSVVQQQARVLRRKQTPAESLLWEQLRGRRLSGLKFRRQHPIDRFIVDFYCASRGLVVEVDGESHAAQAEYDAARTDWLNAHGYRVVRFTNDQVAQDLAGVLDAIERECAGE